MRLISDFFVKMHMVDFPYVVMRNFENLPDSVQEGKHGDLDILVYDLKHFEELFPDIKPVYSYPRAMYKATIGGLNVYIDVRSVGDDYYPADFQINMLETREWNEKGFFTPNPVHFRLGLAYHAVHHKDNNAYEKYLGKTSVEELLSSLKESKIGYVTPKDPTVGKFHQYWRGATSIVSNSDGIVKKSQTSYNAYNLIENEYRILSKITSRHFPKVFKCDDGELEIEHCGDRMGVENLPDDWEQQLVEIVMELRNNSVIHRDIRPDNMMVKDGVIKLIDFGWARFKDDEPDSPPGCLGYPYRPTWGFDDNFSMKRVLKEYRAKGVLCVS